MTTTHKPASGDVGREAFERHYDTHIQSGNLSLLDEYTGKYRYPDCEYHWKTWQAAMRYRDELDSTRKCESAFLCKFCREMRDEQEKGHE